jgi:APA family basic amino acid/polyamine antiporter
VTTAPKQDEAKGSQTGLPRELGLGSATGMVVGSTIGSGIFAVPAIVAMELNSPAAAILCWVVGGLITVCGALSIAELATSLPRPGGPIGYLLEAYGPLPAFLLGWTLLTVITGAVLGAMAMVFAQYLSVFLPLTPAEQHGSAALLILIVGTINYLGVRRAATLMNITTVAKLTILVALSVLAISAVHGRAVVVSDHPFADVSFSSFTAALIPIMWTYAGWEGLTYMGGELLQPQRTVPIAFALGIGCVITVYILINVGLYSLLPAITIAHSQHIAAAFTSRALPFGPRGASVLACLVLLSTLSSVNAAMMVSSRALYAMAERRLFFAAVSRRSPWFRTPSVAIWLTTFLGCAYALGNDFTQLARRSILAALPFALLTIAAVFVLRRTRPDLPRPYRTWGYPVVPAIFLLASCVVLGDSLATSPRDAMFSFLMILSGIPAYHLWTQTDLCRSGS